MMVGMMLKQHCLCWIRTHMSMSAAMSLACPPPPSLISDLPLQGSLSPASTSKAHISHQFIDSHILLNHPQPILSTFVCPLPYYDVSSVRGCNTHLLLLPHQFDLCQSHSTPAVWYLRCCWTGWTASLQHQAPAMPAETDAKGGAAVSTQGFGGHTSIQAEHLPGRP